MQLLAAMLILYVCICLIPAYAMLKIPHSSIDNMQCIITAILVMYGSIPV